MPWRVPPLSHFTRPNPPEKAARHLAGAVLVTWLGLYRAGLYAFEAAERIDDAAIRREWLNFVIVGAGATGVELAGAIAEIARQTKADLKREVEALQAHVTIKRQQFEATDTSKPVIAVA